MPEIDLKTVTSEPPADAVVIHTPPSLGGRPKGKITRPDAPRLVRFKEKLIAEGKPIPDRLKDTPVSAEFQARLSATPLDSAIFGTQPPPPEEKLNGAPEPQAQQSSQSSTSNENGQSSQSSESGQSEQGTQAGAETKTGNPDEHRPLATMLFDLVTSSCASFIGRFWLPRKKGNNAEMGEIPYDEKEMVVSALCVYFASLGMAVLTPLQQLWLAIMAYCAPRLSETIVFVKSKMAKKIKPVVMPDSRQAPDGRQTNAAPPQPQANQQPKNATLEELMTQE